MPWEGEGVDRIALACPLLPGFRQISRTMFALIGICWLLLASRLATRRAPVPGRRGGHGSDHGNNV